MDKEEITEHELEVLISCHSSVGQRWARSTDGVGPTYSMIRAIPRLVAEIRRLRIKIAEIEEGKHGPS